MPIMATYNYSGVQYEFVDTPKEFLEELKCPICLELVSDLVQTTCSVRSVLKASTNAL